MMSEHSVQGPGHMAEVQRLDQQRRILDLPAPAGAHEAPKLFQCGPPLLRRLLLERAERSKFTLIVDDLFNDRDTEGPDQLVLQVRDAHVEAESLHVGASQVGAEASPLETAPEVIFLCGVAEAAQSEVQSPRSELLQEA